MEINEQKDLINLKRYPVRNMLRFLLQDKTTKQNIIWATRSYEEFGEKYSEKQLASLQELLLFLTKKHLISRKYNENFFDQNKIALSGTPGIWGHVSFRSDKSDPHPQKELVDLLKNLSNVK